MRNSNYSDTAFAHAVRKFSIDILHEGPASLFEIPLAYYTSLPNSQRFVAEITALVEAVVKTLSDELYMWERPDDAKFILCDVLKEQFVLLMENYRTTPQFERSRNAEDNLVISIVYRKIRETIEETPEPDDFEATLEMLQKLMHD